MSTNCDRESVRCCASWTLEMWRWMPQHMTFFLSAGRLWANLWTSFIELHGDSNLNYYLFFLNSMHILEQSNIPKIQERGAPCHPATHHTKIMLTASKNRSIKVIQKEKPYISRTSLRRLYTYPPPPVKPKQLSISAIRFFVDWSGETLSSPRLVNRWLCLSWESEYVFPVIIIHPAEFEALEYSWGHLECPMQSRSAGTSKV